MENSLKPQDASVLKNVGFRLSSYGVILYRNCVYFFSEKDYNKLDANNQMIYNALLVIRDYQVETKGAETNKL